MIYSAPTITKEQYDSLATLSDNKEPDLIAQYGFGDKLGVFLQEHISEGNTNSANSDVNFYKLFERPA